ncbi:HAMP domain-containing histidine kinase [Ruminococcaceae bacterium OttesenSCG-928-L11]|nr:HAMP domain-containing histidine kinase [Ruminococcaceae bacterium OttesenSCG-928-L11]
MNSTSSPHSVHQKAKKRGNSLLLRLTAMQVWRNIRFCIRMDFLVFVLTVGCIFVYLNHQGGVAVDLMHADSISLSYEIVRDDAGYPVTMSHSSGNQDVLEKTMNVQYYTGRQTPDSFRLPDSLTSLFHLPTGTLSRLEYERMEDYSVHFKYLLIVPTSTLGEYEFYAFNLLPVASVLASGFGILGFLQFLMILISIFTVRSSTKKVLRPIQDLTAVAHSINATPPKAAAIQELKLSGAIDTLNAINEDRLDTRISIDDEREELKGLAAAINNMLDRLDAAYQAQLRFVSDASHELRTPISVVQGYANLLDRWGKNDEKALQESIDAIKSEAEGMEALVEQLLFLARSDNNTIKTEMAPTNVSVLAEEIVKETGMIDALHTVTGAIDEDLMVYGDAQLLKQAVRIFVDNAIKYTPEGGHIRIAGHRKDGKISLSVTDTGIGIAEKDISHVFERFFRADASRTRKTGGTGLGLSIAQWIVDRHGGYLEVVSRENIGTKITAILPECGENVQAFEMREEPHPDTPYQRPKAV